MEKIAAVIAAAKELNFEEWLKISQAITRTFEEQERLTRRKLKLSDSERAIYFYKMFDF